MKTKNALTVRPNSGLAELKRAESLIRLTESILGKKVAPAHNHTDEQGRKQGYWVERFDDGATVAEGPYVDDKRHGHWVLRFADGDLHEGPFVDSTWTGTWIVRGVHEGPFVDGKRHGHWVVRFDDGEVWEGPMVDGKRHGQWVERKANGTVAKGPMVKGEAHGKWILRFADGDVEECCYENNCAGKMSGKALSLYFFGLDKVICTEDEK